MANKDIYGDNSSPIAKPLASKTMKQLDKSDLTADVNGVSDSRAGTDVNEGDQ